MRFLAWFWDALVGWRGPRAPINGPDDLFRFLQGLARRARDAAGANAPQLAAGARQVTVGSFTAREERRTRKKRAGVGRLERRSAAHPPDLIQRDGHFYDPLVSRVTVYVSGFGLSIIALEAATTYSVMSVFDGTIAQFRWPLAIASGVILFLAGHACGHFLEAAVKAKQLAKRVRFAMVAALVAVATLSICWTGLDRTANEQARDMLKQAGALLDRGSRLEETAKLLEAPQVSSGAELERPPKATLRRASNLRRHASHLSAQATRVEEHSFKTRTLDFFAGVQLLGFMVGVVGGWLFSEATPLRIARFRAKAARLREWINSVIREEAGSAETAYGDFEAELALGGIDISKEPPLELEVEPRLLHERYVIAPHNGSVPEPERTRA
jgi:hypothetical protein